MQLRLISESNINLRSPTVESKAPKPEFDGLVRTLEGNVVTVSTRRLPDHHRHISESFAKNDAIQPEPLFVAHTLPVVIRSTCP